MTDALGSLIDCDHGLIDRRIYIEPDIYEQELKQIFARCWLYLCHDSQIPLPGDFLPPIWAKTRCWWCAIPPARCTPSSTSAGIAATGCAGLRSATPPASPARITAGPTATTGSSPACP